MTATENVCLKLVYRPGTRRCIPKVRNINIVLPVSKSNTFTVNNNVSFVASAAGAGEPYYTLSTGDTVLSHLLQQQLGFGVSSDDTLAPVRNTVTAGVRSVLFSPKRRTKAAALARHGAARAPHRSI